MGLIFGKIRPWIAELAALEHLEKIPETYNGRNVVTILVPSFFNGSSFILVGNNDNHKSFVSLNF